LIGAVFGLIYLLVNSGSLPSDAAIPLRSIGVVAFIVVLVAVARASADAQPTGPRGFGPGYWPIVAGEAVALAVGLSLINGPLGVSKAAVGWVSFIVGAHFVALAVVFEERLYLWLGVAIGSCGLAGLGMAALGTGPAPIAAVSGVIPGCVLLASGCWGARPTIAAGRCGLPGERKLDRYGHVVRVHTIISVLSARSRSKFRSRATRSRR
jgi:hypothetical protein